MISHDEPSLSSLRISQCTQLSHGTGVQGTRLAVYETFTSQSADRSRTVKACTLAHPMAWTYALPTARTLDVPACSLLLGVCYTLTSDSMPSRWRPEQLSLTPAVSQDKH